MCNSSNSLNWNASDYLCKHPISDILLKYARFFLLQPVYTNYINFIILLINIQTATASNFFFTKIIFVIVVL